jgi:hypothetical protein
VKQRIAWRALSVGAGAAAALAARTLVGAVWERADDSGAPSNVAARDVSWQRAFAWSISVAVGVGLARMLAERSAAAAWSKVTSSLPPLPSE